MGVRALTPEDLQARLEAGEALCLLDVREPEEFALGRIEGSIHIPLGELSVRHTELDPELPIVCICHHGIRSASAAAGLSHLGFDTLYNLSGGIDKWSQDVDASVPRY